MLIEIDKRQFFELLYSDDFEKNNFIIKENIKIDSTNYQLNYRLIENCEFNEIVYIDNVNLKCGIKFNKCRFNKGLIFNNVSTSNYSSKYNPHNSSIFISECYSELISFKSCRFERQIFINKQSGVKTLSLVETHIENENINLKESSVFNLIEVSSCKMNILVQKSKIEGNVRIDNLHGKISFIENDFKKDVQLNNIETDDNITFNKNKFEDAFKIEYSIINGFSIHGDSFNKKIVYLINKSDLYTSSLNSLYITEAKFIEGFELKGFDSQIEKIVIPFTPEFQGVLKIEDCTILEFKISGINQNLKLILKRIQFQNLEINDFSNFSDIGFDKCNAIKNGKIRLIDSNLGVSRFNEFDFNSFEKIYVDNITLDKANFSNIVWFDDKSVFIENLSQIKNDDPKIKKTTNSYYNRILKISGIKNPNQLKKEEFRRKREFYRQIKQTLKNNGNIIDSIEFQAKELSSLRNEFKNSNKYTILNRVNMLVSMSNNFGLNWGKPIIILFIITILYYIFILPCISTSITYSILLNKSGLRNFYVEFCNNFNVFWQLFNPIRLFSNIYGNTNNALLHFLDLIHRIISSVLIFQIIKAFRKYILN